MGSPGESRSTAIRLGSYEVLHKFAKGGMAELFLARSVGPEGFEKLVVLKKILPSFASNQKFVQLFLDEAKLAASLDHPNIAHVYDLGKVDGHYFFTMEYVHGKDVRSLLQRTRQAKIPLPIEHAVNIARSAATALHYAHERRGPDGKLLGIVHRDVSPSNVIVSFEGTVKLLDFGVAKAASSTVKTRTGTLKGKVAYMSPEQAKGGAIDRRSDVFSTGIVLWEMIVGARLYKRDNDLATIQMIINEVPPPPSSLRPDAPAELDRIIQRALAVDPDKRYQTAQELQNDLEELARENKLKQSSIALGSHLGTLFATEIEAWKRGEAKGQQLADHIIALSESHADLPTPASEASSEEFAEPSDDEEPELEDEPSEGFEPEVDAEATERTDVATLVTSELANTVASRRLIEESLPSKEPAGWTSEPSIVVDDSLEKMIAAEESVKPVVAAPAYRPTPMPLTPAPPFRPTPMPLTAAPMRPSAPTFAPEPQRRIGVWIGVAAASIAFVAGFLILRGPSSSGDAPEAKTEAKQQIPVTVEPAPATAPPATEPPATEPAAAAAEPEVVVETPVAAPAAPVAPVAKVVTKRPSTSRSKPTRKKPEKPEKPAATKASPKFDPNAALPPM